MASIVNSRITPQLRIVYSVAIFIGVFTTGLIMPPRYYPEGDLTIPFCGARALLNSQDPYSACLLPYNGGISAPYPLTTVLFSVSFVAPFGAFAAPILFALSSALLAFGLLQSGERWKLLLFCSAPFYLAFQSFQWAPLLSAVALFPGLMPLTLVKPQLGIPVFLTRFSWTGALTCTGFALLSLVIDPTWLLRWWHLIQGYDGGIPFLALPVGPLMILALVNWRRRDSRLLFIMSLMPQRWFYDGLLLGIIPASPRQLLGWVVLTWLGLLAGLSTTSVLHHSYSVLVFCYIPLLAFQLYPAITAKLRAVVPTGGVPPTLIDDKTLLG